MVRRPAGRRGADADRLADRLPDLPDPDPDVGDDGDLPADARPARHGLRRADQRGAATPSPRSCCRRDRSPPADDLARSSSPAPSSPTRAPTPRCCATSSFTARPGQTTAIIGSTGSGKTTLVSLIPRLFDATGRLGPGRRGRRPRPRPGRAVEPDRAGPAEAVPVLRHGGQQPAVRQPRRHRRRAVARAAGRPGRGLRPRPCPISSTAPIAQGGTNVSGGQRQRLSIARALVKRPEIYVFDDSFSALDVATDARLRAALKAETRDAA